jgi:hypothetical protein
MYKIPAENKNEFLGVFQIEIRPLGIRERGRPNFFSAGVNRFSASESTPQKKSQKIWDLN